MKTTFRELVARELIKVCETVTQKQREKTATKPTRVEGISDDVFQRWRLLSISEEYRKFIEEFFFGITKDERFKSAVKQRFPIFCVVVPTRNESRLSSPLNKPVIITHEEKLHFLQASGDARKWLFSADDGLLIASPAQVIECISELTDAQWNTVFGDGLFAPILNDVADAEIDITIETPEGT
jgi:hypothetical protein